MPGEAGAALGRGVGGMAEGRCIGVEVKRAFAAGDTGVEQFATEQAFAVRVQGQRHARIFGALRFVDGEGVGVGEVCRIKAGERHGLAAGQVQLQAVRAVEADAGIAVVELLAVVVGAALMRAVPSAPWCPAQRMRYWS